MFFIPLSPISIKPKFQKAKNHKTNQLKSLNFFLNPNILQLMEVLTLLAAFIVAISFMLAPCTASHQLNLPKPLQQVDHPKFSQPSLPRKLIHNLNHETVKTSSAEEELTRHDKFRQASSSGTKRQENEENVKTAAEKETWKWKRVEEEEEEAPNKSEYFTMDYGWVRRRRPIHNKQIPFLP